MNMHSIIHSRSLRGSLIVGSVAALAFLVAACGGSGSAKAPAAASAALATPTKVAAAAAVTKPVTETNAVTSTVKTEAAPAKTAAVTETKAMTESAAAAKTAAMTETKAMTESAAAAAAMVMLNENGTHGKILTDGKGMAIYVFDKDSMDKSSCTGDCLTKWPPLTVAAAADLKAGAGITGKLATMKREDDGKLQVTINGMPLYYYYEDKQPGDAKGQAVGDVWWLVGAEGSKISK